MVAAMVTRPPTPTQAYPCFEAVIVSVSVSVFVILFGGASATAQSKRITKTLTITEGAGWRAPAEWR